MTPTESKANDVIQTAFERIHAITTDTTGNYWIVPARVYSDNLFEPTEQELPAYFVIDGTLSFNAKTGPDHRPVLGVDVWGKIKSDNLRRDRARSIQDIVRAMHTDPTTGSVERSFGGKIHDMKVVRANHERGRFGNIGWFVVEFECNWTMLGSTY